jgi:hypothetical protein
VKRIVIVGLLVLVVVLVVFRQRLFLRDPIAKVERNGLQQTEYRVYLNYFNDILVEDLAQDRRYLVQSRNGVPMVPGVPGHLGCVRGLACLTERNFAATEPLGGKGYVPAVEMTNAYVTFVDGDGASMRVSLR